MTWDAMVVRMQQARFGCGVRACELERRSSTKTMGTASCLMTPRLLGSDEVGPSLAFGRPMIRYRREHGEPLWLPAGAEYSGGSLFHLLVIARHANWSMQGREPVHRLEA